MNERKPLTKEELFTLANAIVRALGEDKFVVCIPEHADVQIPSVRQRASMAEFYVENSYPYGRVCIAPKWPRGDHNSVYRPWASDPQAGSISVAASKAPAQIAREIERRFLPAYLVAWDVTRNRLLAHTNYEAVCTQSAVAIAGELGIPLEQIRSPGGWRAEPLNKDLAGYVGYWRVDCHISRERIDVRITNLNVAQAKALFALVRSFPKAEE